MVSTTGILIGKILLPSLNKQISLLCSAFRACIHVFGSSLLHSMARTEVTQRCHSTTYRPRPRPTVGRVGVRVWVYILPRIDLPWEDELAKERVKCPSVFPFPSLDKPHRKGEEAAYDPTEIKKRKCKQPKEVGLARKTQESASKEWDRKGEREREREKLKVAW